MKEELVKMKVQKTIVTLSCLILAGKFVAYYLTNSVGILTDAMESIVNVVAGFVSLYSLRWSAQPKDKDHPFGHGKAELISASVEGILIAIAGIMIIYEGLKRLFFPVGIQKLDIGIFIIAFSGLVNYLMGWYSIRVGRKYQSMALVAGGKHLQSDTYSTVGLIAGLFLLYFTDTVWVDSLLALVFGGIIICTGFSILRHTTAGLLDKADEQLLDEIIHILNDRRRPQWIDIHNAKIVKSGSFLYLDCDLTIPWYYTVAEGHRLGNDLHQILQDRYAGRLQLTIHLDPCNIFERPKCDKCGLSDCAYRKMAFAGPEKITLAGFVAVETEQEK